MAMLGERPPRSVDEAVVTGEWLSATLFAEYLVVTGTAAEAVNARDVVVTSAIKHLAAVDTRCSIVGKLLRLCLQC